ncbi:carbohydrate ABC transporter substrate-binding protein [Virgibacillus salexigens]|uniref:Carbohydrate ABC transporter, N-acetylglucosamine/diacetylchitobiose-binding protein n=1 Tax=Virgibacillus kapii TaxID=1638645 RepID=A0ABQ2DJS4_9BACI|nr:carbohydrate ABC transporter substrate-binding protein [Virgibacillus kapii]GGJ57988.1 carbohydrate ABC transporter, N-acetylglucosamine/diacetylchitobiose-binding protein [Virgibacillus kapii]
MKKCLSMIFFSLLVLSLAACSESQSANGDTGNGKTTLHVAALESGYGGDMWTKITDAYEAANENVTVELTVEKNLEEVIRPNMQAGEYPDVLLLATGRPEGLTETLIKEDGMEKITDVLDMDVYGEDMTVNNKLLEGFSDTLATNPYADGETYLAPMFYSPTGLFYNAGLFEEKGWEVPKTWGDMWALGEKAAKEGISLFTYPTTGYFDTMVGSMLYASGGTDFFNSAMTYEDGVWETEEATKVLETIKKLADYTHPNTVANANPNDFTKNQQLVLDNEALFMPNGTWVVGEMKEAPKADNFEWGMMSIPSFEKGGDRYAFTFFEQMWIPSASENKQAAKEFITYMYTDEAASIFLESGAVQPIKGITEEMEGDNLLYYNIYEEDGVLPAMGTFASTAPVPGVSIGDTLYGSIDSVISGEISVEEWRKQIEEASDQLRPAMN